MEPVTHILTGACLGRSGLNRRAAYTTLAMAIGAEFPDIDTLWGFLRGPIEGFAHHRGITHTFLFLPVEALVIVGGIYLLHRLRVARASGNTSAKPLTKAPVRWTTLYGLTLLALLSHLLLDFTNNYGIRPFFPFNPHWYAASIVFIFDPLLFLLLLAGLIAPSLFGLVSSEVGARKRIFRGAGWARFALLGIVALWTLRYVEHSRAVQYASTQTMEAAPIAQPETNATSDDSTPLPNTSPVYLTPQRVLASPDPINPFLWYAATDFGPQYQLADINTWLRTTLTPNQRLPKPAWTPIIRAAEVSRIGRPYMDWSQMPYIVAAKSSDTFAATGETIVTFQDLRFLGGPSIMRRGDTPPLTATVEFDAQGHIVTMSMDGKFEQ